MMGWLFNTNKIAKSHFCVWYLGSREADGVRGSAIVLPVMRHLLRESFKKTPSKATVQIAHKGLKLTQSVPALSRSGKVKMQLVEFQISANCITYSLTGSAPFDDVVGVVMLVLNPEMQSPMHVHCYRCDSAETAQIMHANIQLLLSRPTHQRAIMDLEQRLFLSGLLHPRPTSRPVLASRSNSGVTDAQRNPTVDLRTKRASTGDLTKVGLHLDGLQSKRISQLSVSELPALDDPDQRYRLFGDTLTRPNKKTRSLDNIHDAHVSTELRGPPPPLPRRGAVIESLGERNFGTTSSSWTATRHHSFKCRL
ncbi:unnamed protein product, partial [Mesorhabditis belari]|uniref:PID domain-containing protein n=1 Tax=Mesorhabditis belari TaxID=2138241 RepID=A0AAF3EAG2_9BILA